MRDTSGRPVCLVSNHQGTGASARVVALCRAGLPALDGARGFLRGVRLLMDWRDARALARAPRSLPPPAPALAGWRERIAAVDALFENDALDLLGAAAIDTVARRCANDAAGVRAAGVELGFPVALKTGAPLAHKSDAGGVRLNVKGEPALRAADQIATQP